MTTCLFAVSSPLIAIHQNKSKLFVLEDSCDENLNQKSSGYSDYITLLQVDTKLNNRHIFFSEAIAHSDTLWPSKLHILFTCDQFGLEISIFL